MDQESFGEEGRKGRQRIMMVAHKMTVTVEEMAELIGVSRSVAYQLVKEKDFPVIRVSERRLIIPLKSLETWLETRAVR